jgi:hypothetical protein
MQIHEDTETDPSPPTAERESAFQSGAGDWRMQRLMPFSISRRSYFLTWRGTLGLPSLTQLLNADTEAFLGDAIRILFLSLHGEESLEDLRARGIHHMQAACDAWADQHLTMADLAPVILTGLKIWNNASINRHAPDVDPDLTTESPGKSSPSRSRKRST